ncbi:CYFA0S13e02168g1_1 [Cyberlindnera fabianii]|uniref:CYFA0S13e02168g1_1 n=1 Tax=Cyberlindnera fabianii TaxID=36022 RepID=A0A061B2N1_CYBFA|nr:CYFA0S13e02168g1_1 [Cyberlindnera fabianii]
MIEDEDNNPFTPIAEDEFTDLPLSQEEEEDNTQQEQQDTSPGWGDHTDDTTNETAPKAVPTTSEDSQKESPTGIATGTQAYNPEIYTSTSQHLFKDKTAVTIEIIDAGKSREGNTRGYIVYTIKCNDQIVRRRYSEFETLRNGLKRLFPTLIIPPIPEKHKITKYASAPTTAKEDTAIIDHRRRMLSVFLNRCVDIDSVRESSVFQNFLDPNSNWSEVLSLPPLSNIPKEILKADPIDPSNSLPAHSYLPIPSNSNMYVKETEDDKRFNAVASNAREYESVISGGVEKTNKRLVRHFAELGTEFSEAGAVFNGFSLQETAVLAAPLEKFGQVHDNSYLSTETAVDSLNFHFTEPLGESVQFASVVKEVIKFRQTKSMQLDIVARSLKHRLNQLKLIEKAEQESKRIQEALEAGEAKTGQINFDRKVAQEQEQARVQAEVSSSSEQLAPLQPKKTSMFKIPGMSKISTMITGEKDPDTLRDGSKQKVKEEINQLKHTYIAAERDLKRVTQSVSGELQRFQESKDEELKKMLAAYATTIVDWARHNLELWEEAKAQFPQDD